MRNMLLGSMGALCAALVVSCKDSETPHEPPQDADDAAAPASDGGVTDGSPGHDGSTGDAGSVPEPARHWPGYKSGSRLKARLLASTGGDAVQFETWFDTKLEQDCAFQALEPNGTPYCLPKTEAWMAYGDASCEETIWVAEPSYEGTYLVGDGSVFRVDAALTEPAFSMASGTCQPDPALRRLARVDDWTTRFVRGRYEVHASAERLTTEEVFADDGAWQVMALYDQELERRCSRRPLATQAEPASYCVPITVAFDLGYGDDTCQTPLAYVNAGYGFDTPLMALGGRVEPAYCAFSVYGIEGPFDGSSYFTDYGQGTCDRRDAGEPWLQSAWYMSSEPYDTSKLAELAFFTDGEGRLLRHFEGPRGGRALAARFGEKTFFDTKLGLDCEARPTADGKVLCIPRSADAQPHGFADPGCTVPIIGISRVATFLYDDCEPQKVLYARDGFSEVSHMYELGPAHQGPLYNHVEADGGVECGVVEHNELFKEVTLGKEVPLSTFAELSRVVEPS
jgi:hypothetical protein